LAILGICPAKWQGIIAFGGELNAFDLQIA
jgi:hypothetical protein